MNNRASLQLGGDNWAAKDGNLLAYKSSLSEKNFFPIEFDFSRGADIAATRVNSSGLIEKYRENLLLQSNQFDTTWVTGGINETSGQSGYDGSNDAWLIESTLDYRSMSQTISLSNGVYTLSVYLKNVNTSTIGLNVIGSSSSIINVNLSNGTITSQSGSGIITSSVTDLGNGWYRVSVTVNQSITSVRFAFNETAGKSYYIQDAQLERGLAATSYLESGATTGKAGVLDNLPRIDYTGGTGSLLLEPSRSNKINYSEFFVQNWSSQETSIQVNASISPEGFKNAALLKGTTANSRHNIRMNSDTSVDSALSVFAKKKELRYIQIASVNTTGQYVNFDLEDGSVGNIGSDFSNVNVEEFSNGWYRLSVVSDNQSNDFYISLVSSKTAGWLETWSMSNATDGLYIYGAQHEQGSYATSYIPNYSGGSVTRVEDFNDYNDIVANPIVFGANDDFTLFFEGSFDELGNNMVMGGGNSGISGGSGRSYWWITNNSMLLKGHEEISIASAPFNPAKNTNYKLLVKRNGSQVDFYIDGIKISTNQQTTNTPFTVRSVGWSYNKTLYQVRGNIKQVLVFNEALSDNDCKTLTT